MRAAAPSASACRRFFHAGEAAWHVQITQGDAYVSADPKDVLTTVLGSCIAACIRDPKAGVGGMNHFLVPDGAGRDADARRFGVNAMEILINSLLQQGAQRHRLEAKLFGGASVIAGLSDVGAANAAFAERYLADEGIAHVGGHLRGFHPRRIQYWPVSGRARQLALPKAETLAVARRETAAAAHHQEAHDVELF
jgi:chemotaxis protein CheD